MSTFAHFRSIGISRSQLLILGIGFLFALAAFVFPHSVFAATTTETITANTTWVAPDGVTTVYVDAWGGGGGGAGGASGNCCGGGGGGGAYARSMVSVTPGNSYTVVVGIAGTAGANTPTAGGNGGDSMFSASSTILAKGGIGGGIGANGAGGAGGSGSTGSIITYTGGQGGSGVSTVSSGAGGGGAGDANNGGNGSGKNVGVGGLTGGGDGAPGNGAGALVGITATSTSGGGSGGIRTSGGAKAGGAGFRGKVVISYETPPLRSRIFQDGYIFENDDATSTPDTNTQQAAASTSITSVTPGERLTLRLQIRNTGTIATSTYGLFYDRNDGIFTKVRANAMATSSTGGCADAAWTCTAVDTANSVGDHSFLAFDPSGNPWVSYTDFTNGDLRVARYVGSGGTGCTDNAWTCTSVDTANVVGSFTSIAIDPSGNPWVSYYDTTNTGLRVAKYVGSGGTGCANTAWTCTAVDSTNSVGESSAIAFDSSGNPWVSYYDLTNRDLRVARYVGSGGTGCDTATWTCTSVDTANDVGVSTAIAFDFSGNAWVSHYDGTNSGLRVVNYVGSGGTGCADAAWTCTAVDTASLVGEDSSIAIDPLGDVWVSYRDSNTSDLRVARYVGAGGTGCADAAWTCASIETTNVVGSNTSLAFDPSGNPWVSHYDITNTGLRLARYVGSGGTGCALSTWTCTAVDTTNSVGLNNSLAFDPFGNPWLSYYDSTNSGLRVARIFQGGEILIGAGFAGTTTTSITQSHADMLSATDSANRNDADCLTSGASWTNGAWFNTEEGTYTIPGGTITPQCTELVFMLDTSQASSSQTYRFVLATEDGRKDKSLWRGPISGASSTFPTLSTGSSATRMISKVASPVLPACDASGWGCSLIDVLTGSVFIGYVPSITFDKFGRPWISHVNNSDSELRIVRYVGSGGTGCADAAWTCVIMDSVATVYPGSTSLATDPFGNPWISYYDAGTNNDLRVARYVGSGGTGCTDAAWTCTTVVTTNQSGSYSSLAFDLMGNPWVSYYDSSGPALNLNVARYVGSGGTGCASAAWTCTSVDTANDVGKYNSIAVDRYGNPWIAYYDNDALLDGCTTECNLRVARYVGIGGTGCADTAWTCTAVDTANDVGRYTSVTFDTQGNPWVGYFDVTNTTFRVARYVGSGGTGCADAAWTCTTVVSGQALVANITGDSSGNIWASYRVSSQGLGVARYVGSGGTGCTDSAWTCTNVYTDTIDAAYSAIGIDPAGSPWIAYDWNSDLGVAKLNVPSTKPVRSVTVPNPSRSANLSGLQYRLDLGKSPRTDADGTCNANTDRKGYCGVQSDDTHSDTMSGIASTSPIYTGSFRHTTNTDAPTLTWLGQSNVAPSSKAITMQLYHFGSVNAWENVTLTTNTCSSASANTDCTLVGATSTNLSEYYESDGGYYWIHVRVLQASSDAAPTVLKTDLFTFSAAQAPNLTLTHARFRNDDGTESQATFSVAEDATLTGSLWVGDRTRLRWVVSNAGTADATNYKFQLQYGSSSCTAWSSLGDTKEWTPDLSQWVPDGAATTNVAGALNDPGGKDFVAGRVMAGTSTSDQLSVTTAQFMELEYVIRSTALVQALVPYCFRLTNLESTTNFTYTAVPSAILTNRPRPPLGGSGAEGNGQGNQQQGGGAGGGQGAGGEGSGSGGQQTGGGAGGGGGDSG